MIVANGSLSEADYHVLLACELGYIPAQTGERLKLKITEVQKMLGAYIRRIDADMQK